MILGIAVPKTKKPKNILQECVSVVPEQSFEHCESRRIELVSALVFFERKKCHQTIDVILANEEVVDLFLDSV